jgi:serine O-acetyltransferase
MLSPSEVTPESELEKNEVQVPQEAVWLRLVREAQEGLERDPALASLYSSILEAPSLEEAMARRLAARLASADLPAGPLTALLLAPFRADPSIGAAVCADITAVVERDPASGRLIEPFLFFKGFAAIETHRLAHWFWMNGKRDMALYLQSQASEVFHTDIHPAAQFGKGIFLDHATGFVAGETVSIEDNVSILHGVTLGGSGIGKCRRHPRVRTGVLIGAGAEILGDIEIGAFSKIAAGTLVTQSVPPRCTAVGVPARIIEGAGSPNPAKTMDQHVAGGTYESFNYVI